MKHFIKTERKQKEKSRKNQITFGNAEAVYSAAFSNCYSLYHHLRYASLWESMMKLDHRSLCSYNHCLHTTMFDGIIESLLHMAGDYVHFDRYCKYYKKRNNHRANIEVCMLAPWNNSYSTCTYEQSTGLTLTFVNQHRDSSTRSLKCNTCINKLDFVLPHYISINRRWTINLHPKWDCSISTVPPHKVSVRVQSFALLSSTCKRSSKFSTSIKESTQILHFELTSLYYYWSYLINLNLNLMNNRLLLSLDITNKNTIKWTAVLLSD